MSDEARKHVVPTGTSKEALMSSTAATGSNTVNDVTLGIGDFLASKSAILADARYVQFVTVQTAIACLMFLAERESYIPSVAYEGVKPKNVGEGSNLNLTLLANACRSDRQANKDDGRVNTYIILRNWLSARLGVDDQVAAQLLAFCGRLLDMGYGLAQWNGRIDVGADGAVTVTGIDGAPIPDSRNDDMKPWELPGLFRVRPEHCFKLGKTLVPEVEVADLVKVRNPNTQEDELKPYPFERQELTLCDRSYCFTYGDRSKPREYKTQRTSRKTFMDVTDAIIAARKPKPAATTGTSTATGGNATTGTTTGTSTTGTAGTSTGTTATTGATPATGTAPTATTGTGTSTGENRPGGNQSRDDAAKAARDRVESIDHVLGVLAPANVIGNKDVIAAVMRLHLHTTELLRGLGLVEFITNPNDDTRKAALRELSMTGGKPVTPAPTRNPPAKAAPAKAAPAKVASTRK